MENNNNIRQNIHINQKRDLKKKYRYNDSIGKYKKDNPNLIKKQYILSNKEENDDLPFKHIESGITNISSQIKKNDNLLQRYKDQRNYLNKKYKTKSSLSVPKYHLLSSNTPRRDYRKNKYFNHLDSHLLNKTTYNNQREDLGDLSDIERKNNKLILNSRPSFKKNLRYYSNNRFERVQTYENLNSNTTERRNDNYFDNYNLTMNRTNYIGESAKVKELSTLNNILIKHNKKYIQDSRQMTKEINELRIKYQNLKNENKNLLINLSKLKNELENKKDSINEINLKNNQIKQLNEELIRLRNIIDVKENENINLKNQIMIYNNSNKNKNNYNNNDEFAEYNEENEQEDINNNDELRNEINNLYQQINILKQKNQNLLAEKQKNFQMNKERMNKIILDNKKYENMISNLQNELEKYKKNFIYQQQEQEQFINTMNNNEKQINSINAQNIQLNNRITQLETIIQKKDEVNEKLIQEKNELNKKIINLNNEYNMLKSNSLKVSNINLVEDNKNLKDNLDKKSIEIDDLKKKLNIYEVNNQELNEEKINLNEKLLSLVNINNDLNQKYNQINNELNLLKQEKLNINDNDNNKDINDINNKNDQKIIALTNENDELRNKLINYINSEQNNNNKIKIILEEKNSLNQENSELKKELIKLQNNIKEMENENYNNALQLSKYNELKKEYEMIKKENNTNFEELKAKLEENQKLNEIIRNKERENDLLKNKINNNDNIGEMEDDYGVETFNVKINNELEEKKNTIERLEKEVNNLKNINNKIKMEYTQLKEKMQLIQSGQDEGFVNTLDNLKEELKDKEKQIQKLIEDNKNLRNKMKNRYTFTKNPINNINNDEEDEKEIDLNNNKNEFNPFRPTMNSQGLTDADRIKIYKQRLKEFEQNNESDKIQIQTLKEDIKLMKSKIKNLETFGGQIKDMNEFIYLLNQVLINCKPKKKEQKDALNKIIGILNNYQA